MMKNCVMGLRSKLANRKENNKGFTLVELIVVIVILAILAALLVPALVGWINKAREKSYAVEARTAYLAAQTLVSENYYANPNYDVTANKDDVKELSGVNVSAITDVEYVNTGTNATEAEKRTINKITITFTPANGGDAVKMKLENGQWSLTP